MQFELQLVENDSEWPGQNWGKKNMKANDFPKLHPPKKLDCSILPSKIVSILSKILSILLSILSRISIILGIISIMLSIISRKQGIISIILRIMSIILSCS